MRCSSRSEDHRREAALALGLWLAVLAPAAVECAPEDPGFTVREVEVRLVGETYRLDAGIDFAFSPESLEAMENGVPVTVLIEIEVLRVRPLLDERVHRLRVGYRIATHALSGRYVLTDLRSDRTLAYRSFEELLASLGEVRGLPVLERRRLGSGHRYRVRLRTRLDIEALPSPLRPLAYLSPLWRLRSDWFSFDLPS